MAKKKYTPAKHKHDHDHNVIGLWDIIKVILRNKFVPTPKESILDIDQEILRARVTPSHLNVNTIAIVLDDDVVEVMRAENKLSAILLSNPKFILVENNAQVSIGDKYIDGKFENK
jgi:hypothetical protein